MTDETEKLQNGNCNKTEISPISPGVNNCPAIGPNGREYQYLLDSDKKQFQQPQQQQQRKPVPWRGICLAWTLLIFGLTFAIFGALLIADIIQFQSPLPQVRGFDRQFSWPPGGLRSRYRSTSDLRGQLTPSASPPAKLAIKASHLLHRRSKPQEWFESLDGVTPYGLVIFGLLCIIPGAYHVRHVICACCGNRAYRWEDMPNFD